MATLDVIGAASGAFGLAAKLFPPTLRFAGVGASAVVSAQEAAALARGLSMIIAGTDIMNAMMQANSVSVPEHHIMTNKNERSRLPAAAHSLQGSASCLKGRISNLRTRLIK